MMAMTHNSSIKVMPKTRCVFSAVMYRMSAWLTPRTQPCGTGGVNRPAWWDGTESENDAGGGDGFAKM